MNAGDRLAWLGGGDGELLTQVPHARGRFVQMGLVLLTTATLAVLSMSFALHDGMKIPWLAAIPFGLFWGFVIITLDRFLVLSMGTTRDLRQLLLMATPRLAMAALLALVVSTPLVLRVFHSTIRHAMSDYTIGESIKQGAKDARSAEQKRADQLKVRIDQLKSVLNGNLPQEPTSPAVDTAQSRVDDLRRQTSSALDKKHVAFAAWQCELYGSRCHGASHKSGDGPLAVAKEQEYREAKGTWKALDDRRKAAEIALAKAQGSLAGTQQDRLKAAQADARKRLPPLQEEYDKLTKTVGDRAADEREATEDDTGILAQMRALSLATHENPTLRTAHWVVAALFFMIELLPVLVKILMNMSPVPSAYDLKAELRDEALKDQAQIDRVTARQIAEERAETRVEAESDMRRHELGLSKQANARVAEEMETIVEAALEDWSAQVRSQLGGAPRPAGGNPKHNGNVNGAGGNGNGSAAHANGNGSSGTTNGTGHNGATRTPGKSSLWRRPPAPVPEDDEDEDDATPAVTSVNAEYDMPDGEDL